MQKVGRLSLLLFAVACGSTSHPHSRSESDIFRWIAIGPAGSDTLRLGEPLLAAARYAERTSDSTYRLRPGTFGGAESIELRVTPEGLVKEIHFTYPPDTDWNEMVRAYARTLGSGTHVLTEGGELTRWDDDRTRFVVGTGGRADGRIRAALIDLRLARSAPN